MKTLENKVALITGGARGMGAAIALKFADEGCSSVIADILDEPAEKTVEEIKNTGKMRPISIVMLPIVAR